MLVFSAPSIILHCYVKISLVCGRFFVLFFIWEWDDKVIFLIFFASPGTNNIEIKKKQKEQNFHHWQLSIQHVHQYWSRIVQVEKTCSLKIYQSQISKTISKLHLQMSLPLPPYLPGEPKRVNLPINYNSSQLF